MNVQRTIRTFALVSLFLGLVSSCTAEPDRVLSRRYAGYGYCNMKIETAGDPSRPTEREVVDYYGPCDERPTARR